MLSEIGTPIPVLTIAINLDGNDAKFVFPYALSDTQFETALSKLTEAAASASKSVAEQLARKQEIDKAAKVDPRRAAELIDEAAQLADPTGTYVYIPRGEWVNATVEMISQVKAGRQQTKDKKCKNR